MEYYDSLDEIYHHGIKGQKWGVRRYQNKDGSLTIDGGKRYNGSDYQPRKSLGQKIKDHRTASKRAKNLKKAREAAAAKRKEAIKEKEAAEKRKKDLESGKISARKMTQEELNDRINKLNLEKRYKQLMEELDPSSKAVKEGKSFVKNMWDNAAQPAIAEATKSVMKDVLIKQLRKATGLDVDDKSMNALKKEFDTLDLQQKISNAKKTIYDNEKHMSGKDEDESAKLQKEATDAKNRWMKTQYENKLAEEKGFKGDDTSTASEKMNTKQAAQKIVDDYNKSGYSQDSVTPEPTYPKNPKVNDPPDVVKSAVTSLSNVQTNSKDYADKAAKGEKVALDVLDENGNTIVRFDENGKRKWF